METTFLKTMGETVQELIRESLPEAKSYPAYRELVAKLAQEGKTTGPEQTDALINYTRLNDRRMKRWDKTLKFDQSTIESIEKVKGDITWLVLTESWCGDASPALPVMYKISELEPNIGLKIILRDEHPELMNRFLTNGNRSIPKLIAFDSRNLEVLYEWGPRSKSATELVDNYKKVHGTLTPEFKENLQVWYNKDKGKSVVEDLLSSLPLK